MRESELVSARTLSNAWEVRPSTIYQWASERRIPSKKLGRKLLFDWSELRSLLIERPALRPLNEPRPRVYGCRPMGRETKRQRGVYERKPGSGIWWVRYMDEAGQLHREPIGPKAIAIEVYRARKAAIAERRFFPNRSKAKTTVTEAIEQHLAAQKPRIRTYKDQARYGANWIAALGGRKRLAAVTTLEIEEYAAKRLEDASETTVNHELKFLRCVFNRAIDQGVTQRNPVKGVKLYREENQRVRYLTDDEQGDLRENMDPADFELVEFATLTGLRRSEQFGLRWEHVDVERRQLTLPRTKNGETRHVPIGSDALGILQRLDSRLGSDWVWPNENNTGPMGAQNFYNRVFRPALEDAKIHDFRWHDLRHTFASRLVMAGVDLRTVQELMGHKSIQMTMKYAHLSPEHQLEAVDRLSGRTGTSSGTRAKGPRPRKAATP